MSTEPLSIAEAEEALKSAQAGYDRWQVEHAKVVDSKAPIDVLTNSWSTGYGLQHQLVKAKVKVGSLALAQIETIRRGNA